MDAIALTRARSMGPVTDAVSRAGGSVARVFRKAQMPLGVMDEPDRLILLRDQIRLVQGAALEIADAALPARLAMETGLAGLGAIGRHVRSAPTLADAIARVEIVTPALLQTGTWTGLERDGAHVRYGYAVAGRLDVGRQTNEVLALGYLLCTVRHFLGPQWRPDRASVTGAELPERSEIADVFACDVRLGGRAGLSFRADLLAALNPAPVPLAVCENPDDLPMHDDLLACVAHLVALGLAEGLSSIDCVSRRLGISRRTLQRRLGDRGISFAALRKRVLRDEAERLLADTPRPIAAIALDLGYEDPAHFSRAFLAWTGCAPRHWRAAIRSSARRRDPA